MTWAVYDGDVTEMLALRSIFGLENYRLETEPRGVWRGTPTTS